MEAFAVEEQFLLFCDVDEFTQIARAVLARWGTPPAVAGEHKPGCPALGGYGHGVEACCCGATPQPTQAQAGVVPLTDEQRSDIATAAAGYNWTDDYVEAIDYVIDGVESLHGIKGGLLALSERAGVFSCTPEPLEALRYRLLREAERGVQCEVSETEALEFRRLQYGLSRRDFAEILGIMPSHFSEILSGKRRLPINAAYGPPPSGWRAKPVSAVFCDG